VRLPVNVRPLAANRDSPASTWAAHPATVSGSAPPSAGSWSESSRPAAALL